ncbi:MAG: tripartite tricarboxylate transporter permease [Candidatus Woesearchaeota archaeon]
MLAQFFTAVLIGIISGVITGLIPGIHVNLASIMFFEMLMTGFLNFENKALFMVVVISAMMSTHIFIDNIPSIFLGAPDENTMLSVLPGHRMLLKGKALVGMESIIFGSLASMILGVIMLPVMVFALKILFYYSKPLTPLILIFVSICLMLSHKEKNSRFWAFFVFLVSGILGFFALRMPFLKQPLLPLLSGLFGLSVLLESSFSKPYIPEQDDDVEFKISPVNSALGFLSGSLTAVFPAITSSMAALFARSFLKKINEADFLSILGAVNASNIILATIFLLITERARNGALVVISQITDLNLATTMLIIGTVLISSGIASLISLRLSKIFCAIISRIDYAKVSIAMIFFLSFVTVLCSGIFGLLILAVSSSIGFFSQSLNIKRIVLMSCLIFPVFFNYLI